MTEDDPKRIVADGYDAVADEYLRSFATSSVRDKWYNRLVAHLPNAGMRVLDLGCGAGIPVSRDLAKLGHTVIGVDGSREQVLRARRNVPEGEFIQADMCEAQFAEESFDAVGAFYSITHVEREKQPQLISKIAKWLKPEAVFVASFGVGAPGHWRGEWLGTDMFFSHDSEEETQKSLSNAGLAVRHLSIERQDNEDAEFLWIEAVKTS